MGPTISITHWGVKEIEEALVNPDEPTAHFPPVVWAENYLHIETFSGGQVQQRTVNSIQVSSPVNTAELQVLVVQVRRLKDELALDNEAAAELESDLATVEAQAASSRPKHAILQESLKSIRAILESAGGTGVAASASHLPGVITSIEHAISGLT
jgi:hypothetical protein